MMKEIRSGNAMFLPRYLAYTGMGSAAAYYGMGVAIGSQVGGGGNIPPSIELIKQGHVSEGIWAATSGFFDSTITSKLADPQSLKRGLTPAGGFLTDVLGLMTDSLSPDQAWANFGRSASLLIPGSLAFRRVIEGGLTQFVQGGERHKPTGLAEGLSFPVAISRAAEEVFGAPIPGISSRMTGSLSDKESGLETFVKSAGVRTAKADMEDRIKKISIDTSRDAKTEITDHARNIVDALLHGTPEQFNQAYSEAIKSGQFANQHSLHQAIEGARMRQAKTDQERIILRAPRSVKGKIVPP